MQNSLRLGIETRLAIESNSFAVAANLADERMKALIQEKIIPNWNYGKADLKSLESIKNILELESISHDLGVNRIEELEFSLASNECLGMGYEDALLAVICDINSQNLETCETYQKSKKYKSKMWDQILQQEYKKSHTLINEKLSFDARSILSFCKTYTRKQSLDIKFIQSKLFFNQDRAKQGLGELLDNKKIQFDAQDNNYYVDLKLLTKSKYHRAWARLIGHTLVFKMKSLGRIMNFMSSSDMIDRDSLIEIVSSPDSCSECKKFPVQLFTSYEKLPPLHLGCRCTFVLVPPNRGV